MGNVLLIFNPDVPLNKYCKTEEEKKIIRKEYFDSEEWIKSDYGDIKDKDIFDSVKHRIPEKYHESFRIVAKNYDEHMLPFNYYNQ